MERTFGYVYCAAFLELDRQWRQLKSPNMLAFNEVLGKVKVRMGRGCPSKNSSRKFDTPQGGGITGAMRRWHDGSIFFRILTTSQ